MIASTLQTKLFEYQKSKDTFRLSVLRYLLAQIKNKEIELRGQKVVITDDHVLKVIQKQIKQRKETIEEYKKYNKLEKAAEEERELRVLEEFSSWFEQANA